MARVLIVDPERSHSVALGFALSARSYSVQVATSGRDAVEIALEFRPEAVITEWMLMGAVDGLRTARAVRALDPETRVVLASRLLTSHLRSRAAEFGINSCIDKGVALEALCAATAQALASPSLPAPASVGILRFDDAGRVSSMNDQARAWFALPPGSVGGLRLTDFLSYRSAMMLRRCKDEWVRVSASKSGGEPRTARVRPVGGERCAVLLEDDAARKGPDVPLLLGSKRKPGIQERFLVLDANQLQARIALSQLEGSGCMAHWAGSLERACQVVAADPMLRIVLVDYTSVPSIEAAVTGLRSVRADLTIVGTCTAYRKPEFEAAGVEEFLVKPVTARALFERLRGRILVQ